MSEVNQATGSRAFYQVANETSWGDLAGSPNWRKVRLVPGETIDQNIQIYRSREMRGDRMQNASVRGSQKPGGTMPFELSPRGWNNWLYHLFGGSVVTTGPVAGMAAPSAPTATAADTGGSLAAATYKYKITAVNLIGETLPSSASADATVTTSTGKVTLSWSAVTGASGYKIYGRTGSSYLFIAQVGAVLGYVDTGVITPAGAVPGSDTSGSVYTHTITAGVTLPTGFTLEKGFRDVGLYYPFYGSRIARGSFNFNIDQMVAGAFDIMCRQAGDPLLTSLNTDSDPTSFTEKPFTSAQCQVYEGNSLTLLGTTRELQASVDNNFYGDRGYIIGSTLRQNLRPGDRITEVSGKFMFKNADLYNEAVRGDATKFRVACKGDGNPYSVTFDWPNFQFLPMNTTPKATDSGQIDIDAKGEGLPDSGTGTDIVCTIKSPEATITD